MWGEWIWSEGEAYVNGGRSKGERKEGERERSEREEE